VNRQIKITDRFGSAFVLAFFINQGVVYPVPLGKMFSILYPGVSMRVSLLKLVARVVGVE
jgi:hypothetical protein